MDKLDNYEFRGALIDSSYKGEGKISKLLVNGKELKGTYQLPEGLIKKGDNKVEEILSAAAKPQNVLVSSTLRLLSATGGTYKLQAYGKNTLCFRGFSKKLSVTDANGKAIEAIITTADGLTWFDFEGRGELMINLK